MVTAEKSLMEAIKGALNLLGLSTEHYENMSKLCAIF